MLPVRIPGVGLQRQIAALLAAFDDLIEINERRIELLEQLARSLYREWFMRFRFARADLDLAPGQMPDEWRIGVLGELADNLDRRRRPLSKSARAERRGPYPYFGAAKLIDSIDGWIFDGEYLLFAEDGTVQTRDGFPVLQLVAGKFWANNHTHILKGTKVSTRFLYLATSHCPIVGHVTGAAQPKITQSNLNRLTVPVATDEVHAMFDKMIDPMFDAIHLAKKGAPAVSVGW